MAIVKFPSQQAGKKITVQNGKVFYSVGAMNALMGTVSSIAGGAAPLSRFNVFSTMTLTNKNKFKIRHLSVGGIQLTAAGKACSWNPVRGIVSRVIEHSPCEVEHQSEICPDDLAYDCYTDLGGYVREGRVGIQTTGGFTPEMSAILNEIQRLEVIATNEDARAKHSYGKMFMDMPSVRLRSDLTNFEKEQYMRGANACVGYPRLLVEMSATTPHLNKKELLTNNDCMLDMYEGNVVELVGSLRKSAPSELRRVISNGGGVDAGTGEFLSPVCIVSEPIYNKLVEEYYELSGQPVTQMSSIVKMSETFSVKIAGVDRSHTQDVFKVHGLLVLCDPYINELDKYTNATTFFACVTVSGVINFGSNFGSSDGNQETQAGMVVQIKNDLDDGGKVLKQINMLLSTAISDPNYIVAAMNIQTSVSEIA